MSDLGTMEQDIYETLQSLASTTKIRHRILTAIRFHRENRYFFSSRRFQFTLSANRDSYRPGDGFGLPKDLVEIIGSTLWLIPSGSTQKTPIHRVTRGGFDWETALESGSTGEPACWDWFDQSLRLVPTPDDADDLEGSYLRDLGVPIKKYASSTWSFYDPAGNDLSADFTNHWFDPLGGYNLIKQRAMYLCYLEILKDPDRANEALQTWLEEKSRLENETESQEGPFEIEPALW